MNLFRTIVLVAALVGLGSGLVLTIVQHFSVQPLIVQAEVFESQRTEAEAPKPHDHEAAGEHDHLAAAKADLAAQEAHEAAHAHDADAWEPADGVERFGWTVVANVLSAVGFALLLVSASELKGGLTSWREGLLWGLAGFAAFTLAPSVGLPPEAPGVTGAALEARQIWWIGTVAATALGLALIAFGRSPVLAILAVALIAAPHVIGAPHAAEAPAIPRKLEHDFVVAVIVTGFVFWAALGALAGALRPRFGGA
ncbi:cobalt transporter subunit CbtA [Methylopila jiangsuensis]|uniref:Cobalt transporter subunit CbtA n=1 Tax=Methylopila jiangsuensis TaxID=586230 RepID=A0A9W6N2G8_9HYPH|nr:CbtA family protein [Methylopila jiangsuensis]MDR6285522.1 cobalt transporter subunit CbtA [Methylopila jiangsuensis]GLK75280.1 cobalt transporter subunit CbtA [Methylopila jiangsuensis]